METYLTEKQDPLEIARLERFFPQEVPIDAPLEQEVAGKVKGRGKVFLSEGWGCQEWTR